MNNALKNFLTNEQIISLSSIVQVGNATYHELMESEGLLFAHPYFRDTKGRIWTKLVQVQCELESHEAKFPFNFYQREFRYKQFVPELHTKDEGMIIHLGRSNGPDKLPYGAKYKKELSYNNDRIKRQLMLDDNADYKESPFYGILAFGGKKELFSIVQFPEPGYNGIIDTIEIPHLILPKESVETQTFERKKATLKKEFIKREGAEIS